MRRLTDAAARPGRQFFPLSVTSMPARTCKVPHRRPGSPGGSGAIGVHIPAALGP
jgi:hypothetical protein